MSDFLLSICIPTYNRRELVEQLVLSLLAIDGPFEICVHVDGSTDGTVQALAAIGGSRFRFGYTENHGRASALLAACRLARGKFIMLFDDDDTLSVEGLRIVLDGCAEVLPTNVVGRIYHMAGNDGVRVGSEFSTKCANFIALRADHGVLGDKKEVVLSKALNAVFYDFNGQFRRVPTSLLWSRLALDYDVICCDTIVGHKNYLRNGMSSNIRMLKIGSAYPMMLLRRIQIVAFFKGRYKSLRFLSRALVGTASYGLLAFAYFCVKNLRIRRA